MVEEPRPLEKLMCPMATVSSSPHGLGGAGGSAAPTGACGIAETLPVGIGRFTTVEGSSTMSRLSHEELGSVPQSTSSGIEDGSVVSTDFVIVEPMSLDKFEAVEMFPAHYVSEMAPEIVSLQDLFGKPEWPPAYPHVPGVPCKDCGWDGKHDD